MQTLHPVMQTALRGFCSPVVTCNPHADAERWEAEQEAREARAEREEADRESNRAILSFLFLEAIAAGEPLPVRAIGAELESAISEHTALLVPVIRWIAQNRLGNAELRVLIEPFADAWAAGVEGCAVTQGCAA